MPIRDEVEAVLARMLDPRSLDVRVEVERVDEASAALVPLDGDRPHDLLLAVLGEDCEDLAGLEVRPDRHCQLRQALHEVCWSWHGRRS